LEHSQWWSREQLHQFQWREVRRLLRHAFHSVPYYRKKYASAGIELGDIKTREDFAKLPPLTRAEVNDYRSELCSTNPKGRLIPHSTGGSSGVPTRFSITLDSYDWRCAASARAYSWSGYRIGERALYLWGAPVGQVSRLRSAKLDSYRFLRRELVVPTFVQTGELWQRTIKSALRFRPKLIVGYVSSLEQFARFLLAEGRTIPGVQAVIAAAEPVYKETRELAGQAFQAPLFNTYGSREFMSIAAECDRHDGLHTHADNLLIETELDADHGPSELLITDLHNYGMPFIRYRIGDIGVLSDSVCSCGRGLPLLRGIEGRVLEVLRTREGRVVPGEFFPHLMKDAPEVKEFRVQQASLDEIIVSVVLSQDLSEATQGLLRQETSKVFGSETRVTIRPVESIPRLPSGKRSITARLR
jgi:phenylacetate-CoA ligase